jgi:hypothetical protein
MTDGKRPTGPLAVPPSPEDDARSASSAAYEPLDLEGTPESSEPAPEVPLYRADADRVFRLLASHQFEDPFLAFRELYANALDAVRDAAAARIELAVSTTRVVVADRGSGLNAEGLEALVTLGRSTRRGQDAIGRFGIGFVSVFDPALGVSSVEVQARRSDAPGGVRIVFRSDPAGLVRFDVHEQATARVSGTTVTVIFDPERSPADRVHRTRRVFETHAAYSGVETWLDGRRLGRELVDFVRDELEARPFAGPERRLARASQVSGSIGVAAIDPGRSEAIFRVYQRGLFVCSVTVPRPSGRPWIRGGVGAAYATDLSLVASRNDFVRDARYARFREELRRLFEESSYRVVQYWETTQDAYARLVLIDAIRRGLKSATAEELQAESEDLFSSAVVRAPLFAAWGERRRFTFEELAELARADRFRALSFRPARDRAGAIPVFRADDSIEREIFRRLAGARDMPAMARAEEIARPSWFSRFRDGWLYGPKAEYSLFRRDLEPSEIDSDLLRLIDAVDRFLAQPKVAAALARLLGVEIPRIEVGRSSNTFGPVAAYRRGEIRLNADHRLIRSLARHPDPDLAVRALLPVIAHELAHACHELHDLDFYRTSRTLLRSLVTADL